MSQDKQVFFYQGARLVSVEDNDTLEKIKRKIVDLANVRNINFLLGAGASSGAIMSMKKMQGEIESDIAANQTVANDLYNTIKKDDLEKTLEILYSKKFYLDGLNKRDKQENESYETTVCLIEYIENHIFNMVNVDFENGGDKVRENLCLYRKFYEKIALRNRDLARANIFTTNYDLFNEAAMDHLNLNYNNGFGGGLERVFNPARFKYTFSKKVDANLEKFEPLEDMVYLYKLHGSISWVERRGNSLFNIQEIPIKHGENGRKGHNILIYPTPLKQPTSLGSPYADIIREFQNKLSLPHCALFIIGYGFRDEHINRVIYQSLATNSSISIVIFGSHESNPLTRIEDSRVYRIYGECECSGGKKREIHYFEYIVNELIPDADENKDKEMLKKILQSELFPDRGQKGEET